MWLIFENKVKGLKQFMHTNDCTLYIKAIYAYLLCPNKHVSEHLLEDSGLQANFPRELNSFGAD